MTKIAICLVGKDGIFKEGVKSLLVNNDFHIARDCEDAAKISKEDASLSPVELVVGIDEETGDLSKKVYALKNINSKSRVVIISSRTEMPVVIPAFAAGVDGYILKDISCDGLVGALRLAAAGEKVYPTSMLSMLNQQAQPPAAVNGNNGIDQSRNSGTYPLSRQELKIIHRLASGEPNKVIAYHLDITEATVKVHVKTILRKLGATNRTQAAVWAIANGLANVTPKDMPHKDMPSIIMPYHDGNAVRNGISDYN